MHSQHPREGPVVVGVDTLHIGQGDLLPQDHLVKGTDEKGVQEASVENGQAHDTSNKLEVAEMLGVDAGVRVDLQRVVVNGRILEQAVKGIEHLVGEEEEELATGIVSMLPSVNILGSEDAYRERPP